MEIRLSVLARVVHVQEEHLNSNSLCNKAIYSHPDDNNKIWKRKYDFFLCYERAQDKKAGVRLTKPLIATLLL